MDFEIAYAKFMERQVKDRAAHSRRLAAGLGHAERRFLELVWWPAFHSFDHLYPEYLIKDFTEQDRYLDFAYIREQFRLGIEIDGYGPHYANLTQEEYALQLRRQNFIFNAGWGLVRYAYYDVEYHPMNVQQSLQQTIGRLLGAPSESLAELKPVDRDIIRLAIASDGAIKVVEAAALAKINRHTCGLHMKQLANLDWLEPVKFGPQRTQSYRLHPSRRGVRF